ncbi:MAG: hypothetical protein ACRBBS_17790 [Thalassovita sp.]
MTAIDPTAAPTTPAKKISTDTLILLITLLAVAAWGASVYFFGIPGLYIPALALVPVMYLMLIVISRG